MSRDEGSTLYQLRNFFFFQLAFKLQSQESIVTGHLYEDFDPSMTVSLSCDTFESVTRQLIHDRQSMQLILGNCASGMEGRRSDLDQERATEKR